MLGDRFGANFEGQCRTLVTLAYTPRKIGQIF